MDDNVLRKTKNSAELSTADLIRFLQNPEESDIHVEILYTELHIRFKNAFYKKCLESCENLRQSLDHAADIFQNAFIKLLRTIKNYKVDEFASERKVKNQLISWFGKAANTEIIDCIRKNPPTEEMDEVQDEWNLEYDIDFDDEVETTEDVLSDLYKLRQALSTLSEKEQDILLVCANYGCLGNSKHLPDDAIDDLCKKHSITTPKNLKTIRFRAFNKIKSLLNTASTN